MSRLVEKFLQIETYEEFDKRRKEFRDLKADEPEVREHMGKLLGYIGDGIKDGIIYDLSHETPTDK